MVVAEAAYEISQLRPDARFVVFSPGHRRFFEVKPKIGKEAENGLFSPNMPKSSVPIWTRNKFHKHHILRRAGFFLVRPIIKIINQARWKNAYEYVKEVDLCDGTLIAMGRPQFIYDYIQDLKRDNSNVKLYPLLHDLIPLHNFGEPGLGELFTRANFLNDNKGVIQFAEGIITNSEFTKNDLESFSAEGILPPLPPLTAVPLVHEHRCTPEEVQAEATGSPYLLCVGSLLGRKNLEVVFDALCRLDEQQHPVPRLLLAGASQKNIRQYLKQEKYKRIHTKVEFVINPDPDELARLYQMARALVIPSKMEGWGLPAGEALWLGTPVISSTAPALKEVCGDLALYFDPASASDLANQISKLMLDENYYSELKSKIFENKNRLRSWNDFARGVLEFVQHGK